MKGEGGLHWDGGKARLADTMPWDLVLNAGAIWAQLTKDKYPDNEDGRPNFKAGIRLTRYLDSMLRHLFALIEGEDQDPESGFDHAGHLLCNLAMFWWTRANLPGMDDRETKPANGLDPRHAETVKKLFDNADVLEKTYHVDWEGKISPSPGPEDPVT